MGQRKRYNITKDPLPKLFRQIALPSSIGAFFHTMYNVVDTYFAGQLSTQALAALSISFPVFFIVLALSMGISQGSGALIANELGKKKQKRADEYTGNTLVLAFVLGLVITAVSLLVVKPLFGLLGAQGDYLQLALDYMRIILYATPVFIISFAVNGTLAANGDTKTIRNSMIAGFMLNFLLNPWFMYGWLGFPALGIKGIALATVVIETLSVTYRFIIMKGYVKNFKLRIMRSRLTELIKQSYPISLNRLLVSAGIFIITYYISGFGEEAVAAYGIAVRIEQIALLPSIGLSVATLTIVGQNNGAKLYRRIEEAYKLALRYGLFVAVIGGGVILLFGSSLLGLFTDNEEVISIGSNYLLIAAFLLFFYITVFTTISLYQGLKQPMISFWEGLLRQIALPMILFPVAISMIGMWGVWITIAIKIIIAALIMTLLGRGRIKRLLGEENKKKTE